MVKSNKKTANKVVLAKKPVPDQVKTTKRTSNSSLRPVDSNETDTKKHQNNYSISAMASEICAQYKQQLEGKSIAAIAPEINEQYKLKQLTYFNDLRNRLKSDLHDYKVAMLADAVNIPEVDSMASAQASAEALLEQYSLKNAISEAVDLLKAGDLYDAIRENDSIKVAEITGSYNPVFPLLKNLLIWATMSQDGLIAVLEKGKKEFDLLQKKNKERTKKAIETRKATSKMNEIYAFVNREQAKCNLNSPDITSEAVQKFHVTPQYINKLKSDYLSSKKK